MNQGALPPQSLYRAIQTIYKATIPQNSTTCTYNITHLLMNIFTLSIQNIQNNLVVSKQLINYQLNQCRIKGGARGAAAPGPAVFWARNWWEW